MREGDAQAAPGSLLKAGCIEGIGKRIDRCGSIAANRQTAGLRTGRDHNLRGLRQTVSVRVECLPSAILAFESAHAGLVARLNAVADLFASGRVWVHNTHWAEELVEEVASFPSGEHDDMVDSMSQALLRYRRGGFIQLDSDEQDDEQRQRRKREYY